MFAKPIVVNKLKQLEILLGNKELAKRVFENAENFDKHVFENAENFDEETKRSQMQKSCVTCGAPNQVDVCSYCNSVINRS